MSIILLYFLFTFFLHFVICFCILFCKILAIGIVKVRVVLSGFSFVIGDELDPRIDINITDIHRLSGSVTVYPNGDFECSAELGSFRISNVFEYVVPAYEESSSSEGVSSSKRIQGALEAARLSHPAFPWLLSTCSADERFQLESIFLEEECMSNTPFVSLHYSDFRYVSVTILSSFLLRLHSFRLSLAESLNAIVFSIK